MWYACLYKIDRAYGGPEEGGWYYDCGEAMPQTFMNEAVLDCRFFMTKPDALAYIKSAEVIEAVDELNEELPSIDSVLSVGRYAMMVGLGMPENFPKERPHYE